MDAASRMPTVLGLGMSRSGTRWLARCLAEHPEVCVAPQEALFFVRRCFLATWSKAFERYFSQIERCGKPNAKARGEISPIYLGDDESPRLIHRHFPGVKLICLLRDQSEWLYSAYRLFLHFNSEIFKTGFSFGTFLPYSTHIFREVFFLEHIRKVYRFLGVDDSFKPLSITMKINPVELTVKRSHHIHRLLTRLRGKPSREKICAYLGTLNTVHVARDEFPERHRLTDDPREEIRGICAVHNKALGEFLGRHLRHWSRVP